MSSNDRSEKTSESLSAPTPTDTQTSSGFKLHTWMQLMRIGNVFTVFANILMGYLVVSSDADILTLSAKDAWPLAGLLAATFCLYSSGMVLNDVFDIAQDKEQRSERPLVTGAISLRVAARFGTGLMLAGILFASTAGIRGCLLGCAIAVSVLLYNRVLKKTPLAPLMMGMCRTLNVLLGMSLVASDKAIFCGFEKHHLLIAGGIGIFVAGLTWFARTEARTSNRGLLSFGVAIMALGFVCLSSFPTELAQSSRLQLKPNSTGLLFGVLAILILYRAVGAIFDPRPERVQVGVIHCLRSLIFLDACVVAIVSHSSMAVLTIALLLPMLIISKWIRAT
jgi:hypothetical protein